MAVYIIGNPTPPSSGQFDFTHYVSGAATGSGDGLSRSSPWTMQQAIAAALPDMNICLMEGIIHGNTTSHGRTATFQITRPGTAGHPIRWICENYAALSSTGRTQFTNNGTFGLNSCPVLGISGAYNEVYGPYIYEPQANPGTDTCSLYITGDNITVRYAELDRGAVSTWNPRLGDPGNTGSNTAGIFIEPGRNITIEDNRFKNYTSATQVEYGMAGVIVFSSTAADYSHSLSFRHNDFQDVQVCVYLKGAGADRPIHGNIRFEANKIRLAPLSSMNYVPINHYAINIGDCDDQFGPNRVMRNIMIGSILFARPQYQSDTAGLNYTRNVLVGNNTVIGLTFDHSGGFIGSANGVANQTPASWRVHNNLVYSPSNGPRMYLFTEGGDAAMLSADHNTIGSLGNSWSYIDAPGMFNETLAVHRARTGREANSAVRAFSLVSTSYDSADYGLLPTVSAERNSGIDVFNLLNQGTSAPIHRGARHELLTNPGIRPIGVT